MNKKGFTLVELLVAMTIFGVIMIIVSSAFISSLNLQRHAFNVQTVQENSAFVLEFIAKDLRTARILPTADTNCNTSMDDILTVTNQQGEVIEYSMSEGNLIRKINGTPHVINSNLIQFADLGFCILGASVGDFNQPRITMTATVQTPSGKQQATAHIQTTLSLRFLSD